MKPLPGSEIAAFQDQPKKYRAVKTLLDGINGVRRALELGDYAPRPQYDRWGTVSLSASAMHPGSPGPVWGSFTVGSVAYFGAGASMHGSVVLPQSLWADGGVWPVLRFMSVAAVPGEVRDWTVEVIGAPRDGAFPAAAASATPTYTLLAGDTNVNRAIRLPALPFAAKPGDTLLVEVTRGSLPVTTPPVFLGVDFDFRRGPFGAKERP